MFEETCRLRVFARSFFRTVVVIGFRPGVNDLHSKAGIFNWIKFAKEFFSHSKIRTSLLGEAREQDTNEAMNIHFRTQKIKGE